MHMDSYLSCHDKNAVASLTEDDIACNTCTKSEGLDEKSHHDGGRVWWRVGLLIRAGKLFKDFELMQLEIFMRFDFARGEIETKQHRNIKGKEKHKQ